MRTIRILLAVLFAMGLFTISAPAQAAEKKIGYVDLSRLFDEYYKTKEQDKVLEVKYKDFEKASKEKVDAIQDAQNKLALLSTDKKIEAQKNIEKMKTELLEFDRQQKTNLTKERNEKIREILLEIEKIVSNYAEKEGFSFILNDRVLIYGDQSVDLTAPILKILNDNAPKK